jgi:phosphate uptake regulator
MQQMAPESSRSLNRLLPLADQVSALATASGRAVVDRDAALARALIATDGKRDRCDSALRAAWTDVLGSVEHEKPNGTSAVELLVSLERITALSTTICREVMSFSSELRAGEFPSIRRLAELVPSMLHDALGAVRANDRRSAEKVLDQSIAVDTCYAQAHSDLLQIMAKQGPDQMDAARQLHAVGRALERIGDNASGIAAGVRAQKTLVQS